MAKDEKMTEQTAVQMKSSRAHLRQGETNVCAPVMVAPVLLGALKMRSLIVAIADVCCGA